jgi:hypothetical protein
VPFDPYIYISCIYRQSRGGVCVTSAAKEATRCIRTDCRVGALAVTVSNPMRGYITMTVDLLAMMQVYSCHGGC